MGNVCENCGSEIQRGVERCPLCGELLSIQNTEQSYVESARTPFTTKATQQPVKQAQQYSSAAESIPKAIASIHNIIKGGNTIRRGTSNIPLVMGITGAVVMLPALMCSACAGTLMAIGDSASFGGVTLLFGIVPIIAGIYGGVIGKSKPPLSFIVLLVAAIATFISLVLSFFLSPFDWAALILFIIGAIMAKIQKME